MKIIIMLIMIVSCNRIDPIESFNDRIVRQSTQYCSCHGGIELLTFNPYDIYLLCKDGTEHKASGEVIGHQIIGCVK